MKNNGINIAEWSVAHRNQPIFYMAVINTEGQLTFVNSHFFTSIQQNAACTKSRTFFECIHSEDLDRFKSSLEKNLSDDHSLEVEIRMKSLPCKWVKWQISSLDTAVMAHGRFLCLGYDIDGESQRKKYTRIAEKNSLRIIDDLSVAIIFQDKSGAVISANRKAAEILDTTLDITEAFNAREEAKKAAERLFYISQASSEAIWDWDMATGEIYCNQALQILIGSELNKVLDLDWCFQCIHEDDRARVEETIRKTMEHYQQSWEMEYRFLTIDGNFKTVYNRGFIIYENSKAIRMIGSLKDISEIKKLETQIVRQRLKQQKGVAETIIQAQQEERARIGHELHDNINQILTSAHLYLSVLDQASTEFGKIKSRALEIINLAIEEIRLLSKDMVMPDFREEGLLGSLGQLVDDLRLTSPFNVQLKHNDRWRIESLGINQKITLFRIVQEQIKNIVKYSKAINVTIELIYSDMHLRLVIMDDGVGFDAKSVKHGLGLSNIYERSRLYNGKAVLKSQCGKGCSLIICFPLEGNFL